MKSLNRLKPSLYQNKCKTYPSSSEKREAFRLAEEVGERQAEEQRHVGQDEDPVPQS